MNNTNRIIGTGITSRGKNNQNDCKRVDEVIIEKIIIIKVLRGEGTYEDPSRTVNKYFDMDGKFLFEIDSWKNQV